MKEDPDKWKDSLMYGKNQTNLILYTNQCAPNGDPSRCPAEIEKLTLKFIWKREGLRRT